MRRMFLVAAVVALFGATAVTGTGAAQEPEFKFGFQVFAELAPDLVGDPLENERHDAIGNAFQPTTGGLLVWHRLDNVVDFTNGSETFLLTEEGILTRSNDERFQFEVVRQQFEEALEAEIQALIEEGPADLEQQIEALIADFQEQLEQLLEQPEQVEPEPEQVEEQPEPAPGPSTFRVTIENLTSGQPLSPPVAASHSADVRVFQVGGLASDELAAVAQDGNPIPLFELLSGTEGVTQAANLGRGLPPTQSAQFEIQAGAGDSFSLATMLACTNDGFAGLDSVQFPQNGPLVFLLVSYDAGREINTETIEDLVDRCGIPVGEPLGRNAEVATIPPDSIGPHPGILGVGQLDPALVGWVDPVARVTIERIVP